jgi:hypothetical protein
MSLIAKCLLVTIGCIVACSASAASEAEQPLLDGYFRYLALDRSCHPGETPVNASLLAYKQQVLDTYRRQLVNAPAAQRAVYLDAITQVEVDAVPAAISAKMQAAFKRDGGASSRQICKNVHQMIDTQVAIGKLAAAENSGDPAALRAATKDAVVVGNRNSQTIQADLPAYAPAKGAAAPSATQDRK